MATRGGENGLMSSFKLTLAIRWTSQIQEHGQSQEL